MNTSRKYVLSEGPGNDAPCPVAEELLGELYRAKGARVEQIILTLSEDERGSLAVFCYGKTHMRELGLKIAATCTRETLVNTAGRVGDLLFVQSRERIAGSAGSEFFKSGRASLSPIRASGDGD